MKAKQKSNEIITEESSPNSPEFETVNETNLDIQLNCDQCEISFETDEQLQLHVTEKHGARENNETCEIKLEIFCLVENENDVFATRTMSIEKLNEQNEVESVDKVFVDKNESFLDIDNLQWNSVDIYLQSKENAKVWNDLNFRRKLFSQCYLWETWYGERSRVNLKRMKEDKRLSDMRLRGYVV